jgi:23S rRNA pseudouridine1911/1915/1917 synthase
MEFAFNPEEDEPGLRLDVFLTAKLEDYSRSAVKRLIDANCVTVSGKTAKANYKIAPGDIVEMTEAPSPEDDIAAEDIPLDILFEDNDIIVINKPQGMVVHPAAGNYSKTLVNALLFHCGSLSALNGDLRPGIVHRIDKDTSGVLVAAKNDVSHRKLAEQFAGHSAVRRYICAARGILKEDSGTIDKPIGRSQTDRKKMAVNYKNGKRAVTHYKVLERFQRYTLTEARLETGRTHQIRVHLSSIFHPLAGDIVYGGNYPPAEKGLNGQVLHAFMLGFNHPATGNYMEFATGLPGYFQDFLNSIK